VDLTFSGFPIGRVRRIELAEDGTARILVVVPLKDAHWLRTSSVFTLTRGLVGGTNLRAYSGILSDPPLPGGAQRKVLIGDATAEIPRLLADTRELIRNLTLMSATDAPLNASLDNVRELTDKARGPRGALGALFGNEADAAKVATALDRANALLARVNGLTARVDGIAAKADAQVFGAEGLLPEARATIVQLNGALADARASLQKVDALLVDAQAVAGNVRGASTDLGALRAEVEASLRRVTRLIDDVNRRWPFARETELKLP
jgi:phospholipid/cholesterol/gamma-HCH transport system substrate-binding protein